VAISLTRVRAGVAKWLMFSFKGYSQCEGSMKALSYASWELYAWVFSGSENCGEERSDEQEVVSYKGRR